MAAYYNEIDPFAAQWLKNLIDAGQLPTGDVDTRSIEDVTPNELRRYTQCHFFAGIGGWPYALALAGWPTDRPVWTGSCPCQPFSTAGKGHGFADQRHLWPAWFHLIRECKPAIVFGEQVASKNAGAWIDLVHADLEGMGYAFGCVALPAASIGAPHVRDRAFWMADADHAGSQGHWRLGQVNGSQGWAQPPRHAAEGGLVEWIEGRDGYTRPIEPSTRPLVNGVSGRVGRLRAYGNAIVPQVAAQFIAAHMDGLELEQAA